MPSTLDANVESTFNDLAQARLRDTAPALMDYIVGFQLMKVEDDGERAVGIFCAEIDSALYYIPCFFISGEIQGVDSIYSEESDIFFPLTEEWINNIVGRNENKLGKPDPRSRLERGVKMPNYASLRQMPGMSGVKFAAAQDTEVHLPEAVADLGAAEGFLADLKRLPKLAAAVSEFYSVLDFAVEATVKVAAERDLIIVGGITDDGVKQLTDEQRTQVLRGGIAVTDKRPELKKSVVYRTQTALPLRNPSSGGLYEVVMANGELEDCLIGVITEVPNRCFVYRRSDRKAAVIDHRLVWVRTQYDDGHFRKALDEVGTDLAKVGNGDDIVAMSNNGTATPVYHVGSAITGVDSMKVLRISENSWPYDAGTASAHGSPWQDRENRRYDVITSYGDPARRVKEIVITERGNNSPKFSLNKLILNSQNFKAIVLREVAKDKGALCGVACTDNGSSCDAYALTAADFGDPDTVLRGLTKSAAAVGIWRESTGDYAVRVGGKVASFEKVAAVRYLAGNLGIDGELAVELVDEATASPKVHSVKLAAELLPFPDMPDPASGGIMSAHHPETGPRQGISMAASPRNEDVYRYVSPFEAGGEVDSAASTNDVIQTAANSGQKEVFDAAVLAALLKTKSPAERVEKYLPAIVSGMDRLGRTLFMMRWRYDEFEDKYGEAETASFIDELVSTFKELGDVVIFLKKKSLAGDPTSYGLGLSGDADATMDV